MLPEITPSLSNLLLIVVLIELVKEFNDEIEPVIPSIESTRFFKLSVVVATLELKEPILVDTEELKLPIEELKPDVVVATEELKDPIDDVNDELKLVIVLVNPLVVVATDELNVE